MKDFLKRIKVFEEISISLKTDKAFFIGQLKEDVESKKLGVLSDYTDVFSGSKKEYKGSVDNHGFKITKRKRLFDTTFNFSVAQGKFKQVGENLVVDIEISGLSSFIKLFYILAIIIYAFFIGFVFIALSGTDSDMATWLIPFLLLHASLMFLIPFFIMRRGVQQMKRKLERDFFYMIK